ncbi:MAG: metallophosphoesterase [Phycisphaerae bacterium]|nr:metallophosphoesterase [Phycisphaerae bacterium]
MACAAVDIFRRAAGMNRQDDRREGNVLVLASPCRIVLAGDIHGNRGALGKIISHAALASDPQCRLVLQEILHDPPGDPSGHDRSIELLMRAAWLKTEHPEQVLFVMGNHDLAQVAGSEISKYGHGVCKVFVEGVKFAFADDADEVMDALEEFFLSLPLAIRCPNGVFISHSLPSPGKFDDACVEILTRPITLDDMQRNGPAYNWVWGRGHTEDQLETLAAKLGAEFFLMAHQHNKDGYDIISPRGAVVLSDHAGGYIVEFRDDQKISGDSLGRYLKPLAAL